MYERLHLSDRQSPYTVLHETHRNEIIAGNSPDLFHGTYFPPHCSSTNEKRHLDVRIANRPRLPADFQLAPHYLPTTCKVARSSLPTYIALRVPFLLLQWEYAVSNYQYIGYFDSYQNHLISKHPQHGKSSINLVYRAPVCFAKRPDIPQSTPYFPARTVHAWPHLFASLPLH